MQITSETIRYSKRKTKQSKNARKCHSKQNRTIRFQNKKLKKELQGICEANSKSAIFRSVDGLKKDRAYKIVRKETMKKDYLTTV